MHVSRHSNHTTLCISFFALSSTAGYLPFGLHQPCSSLWPAPGHVQPAFLVVFCWIRFVYSRAPATEMSTVRTGSDWIRTEADFGWNRTGSDCNLFQNWQIKTGSDCNFFQNWQTRTGSDRENFCCFDVIILKISKILVVIQFHRFAEWQWIFRHQMQKLCWDYFAIRTVTTFVHI